MYDGVVTLTAAATAFDEREWGGIYRTKPPAEREANLTAIPYYLWANRGQGSMVVWRPEV